MRPPKQLLDVMPPPRGVEGAELSHTDLLRWLFSQQKVRGCAAWCISVLAQPMQLAMPWLIGLCIDRGVRAGDRQQLLYWGTALIVLTITMPVVSIMRHRIMTAYRTMLRAILVRAFTRHVERVGAPLSRQVAGGEMTTAVSTDLDRLGMLFTSVIPGSAAILGLFGGLGVLAWLSPWICLTAVLGIVFTAVVVRPIAGWFYRADVAYRHQQGEFNNYAHDVVTGLRVLTGVGGKDRYRTVLDDESATLLRRGLTLTDRFALMITVSFIMPALVFILVVWVSAVETMRGELSVGQLVQAVNTAGLLVGPMMFINGMFRDVPSGLTAAKRSATIFNIRREVEDHGSLAAPVTAGELRDGVTGAVFRPSRMTGLVSQNPRDVEVMMERLSRFRPDAETQDVMWAGHPINDYTLGEVREQIHWGESHSYFLAGSLREALTLGADYHDEAITAAVQAAHGQDIVDALPDGLDSHMPSEAKNVSGGQRQRLRLARNLLPGKSVLLLMEPTSALDATTESVVAEKLAETRRGLTTVIATPSPLVLSRCDDIVFVPDGGQAVMGSHQELLENADYRRVVLRSAS